MFKKHQKEAQHIIDYLNSHKIYAAYIGGNLIQINFNGKTSLIFADSYHAQEYVQSIKTGK